MMKLLRLVVVICATSLAVNAMAAPRHSTSKTKQTASQAVQKINVNTATVDQIAAVKGLGSKKAAAIVHYRQAHGQFKSLGDLDNVPGIGSRLIKKFAGQLVV